MNKLLLFFGAFSILLILGGIAGAGVRTASLEQRELFREGNARTLSALLDKPGSTPISVRLDTVTLEAGEQVIFELCSQDQLQKERWLGELAFAVLYLDNPRLMFKTPFDRAHLDIVKRDRTGACLVLGGGYIEAAGRYSVDAVWYDKRPNDVLMQVGLYTRVMVKPSLITWDRLWVIAIAIGAMLFTLTLFFLSMWNRSAPSPMLDLSYKSDISGHSESRRQRFRSLSSALGCIVAFGVAIAWTPLYGSTMGFLKGLMVAAAEISVAVVLISQFHPRGGRVRELALFAPGRRPFVSLAISVASAGALVWIARYALILVPSTAQAPIETFIAWPSGIVCFAALGMVVPLGEEVFFRGFVYRAALGYGRIAAFAVTLISFVGLHVQQDWGNWGGLVALTVTGAALTGLRAVSGSTLLPAITHLLYNFVLSIGSF